MRIGIIIGRIGDVDGVALETEKWIKILHDLKHEVFVLSGRFTKPIIDADHETIIPNMSFFSPNCEWEQNRAFFFPPDDPDELLTHLHSTSDGLAIRMFKWVMQNKLDMVISENASALPAHLSMGMAIKKLVEATGIKVICHDHDFSWERGDRYKTPFPEVEQIIKETFPLQIEHASHAVINTYGKDFLQDNYNIDSIIVPNVMDFNEPYGRKDKYNKNLLKDIGLNDDDIPLFQITRIVRRKGIETAIRLVEMLDDKKVKLVITGSAADDERKGYFKELVDLINEKKLNEKVIFAYRRILNDRGSRPHDGNVYSLSDAYAHSTACTYFSTYEGFGNAFVEACLAKKPIFVNDYKPVYWPDIGSKGFKAIMLEDSVLTDAKVNEMNNIIHDPKLQKEIGEFNHHLGRLLFSYDVLKEKLEILLRKN
ncbi:MAG: glycosyltransferase [Calditrichaeota bacterium]|nr:MAG: glycosyltransferase [Calditrichota bacterium]MBL1205269.1 glycosyltransferase [Calditrichota bacterium]NOG45099.1 glycosyltransferase family 4 protein [Calditrichota bacterium]